jgi:hypothetical protein|tara:strand:- start:226 stop:348 length:123 start_codon:yes stop_codon:yes gene_type:complete
MKWWIAIFEKDACWVLSGAQNRFEIKFVSGNNNMSGKKTE